MAQRGEQQVRSSREDSDAVHCNSLRTRNRHRLSPRRTLVVDNGWSAERAGISFAGQGCGVVFETSVASSRFGMFGPGRSRQPSRIVSLNRDHVSRSGHRRILVPNNSSAANQPTNPNLRVDPSQTGSHAYSASDSTDPRFSIEASIRTVRGEQILSFLVVAQLRDGTRGRLRGSEFFNAMMDHFGDAAVDVIEGQWETTNPDWTTNLEAFNRITGSSNVTEAIAATQVPTGIYAIRRGFSKVTIVTANPVGARGKYTEVLLQFRK
jgi:hypothetical protein